jgi:hypothetical protein
MQPDGFEMSRCFNLLFHCVYILDELLIIIQQYDVQTKIQNASKVIVVMNKLYVGRTVLTRPSSSFSLRGHSVGPCQ